MMPPNVSKKVHGHAAATQERIERAIEKLRQFLAEPEQRGRIVKNTEVCRALRVSVPWFDLRVGTIRLAQEWLTINQDAPLDAKAHYHGILERGIGQIETEARIKVKTRGGKREFFVSRESAQKVTEQVGKIAAPVKGAAAKIEETVRTNEMAPVNPKELVIQRVREAYCMAPLGAMPNVSRIMRDLGLIDKEGRAQNPQGITEEEVRAVMAEEDWKGDRQKFLHQTLDVVPDEIRLITMMRNVETQKILFDEIKMQNHMNNQYRLHGRVMSLQRDKDGNQVEIDHKPDPGVIAGLAEVMRRMVDGGGNVNIMINQFGRSEGGAEDPTKQLSLVSKRYLGRLASLSADQVKLEIERFDSLRRLLEQGNRTVSLDEIEAEDAVFTEVKTSDPT